MVFGGGGQRHENDGLLHQGQFRNRHGTGTRNDHVGQAVGQVHAVDEDGGLHLVLQAQAVHFLLCLSDIGLSRLPDELQVGILECGQLCADALVDAQGTLAAAHQQRNRFVRVEMEVFGSFFAGAVEDDVGPQRIAREVYLFGGEPLVQVVVGHADGLGFLAHIAVGLARIGVLLLNDRGDAQVVGSHQSRSAGKAAHANHHIGLEAFQDGDGAVDAVHQFDRQRE